LVSFKQQQFYINISDTNNNQGHKMPILNIQSSSVGLTGTLPSVAYIQTSDTEAQAVQSGLAAFSLPCMCCVSTQTSSSASAAVGWYELSYVANSGVPQQGNWSLVSTVSPGNVILPTIVGQLSQFADVDGTLEDSGILFSNVVVKNAVNTLASGASIVANKVNGTEATNAVTASGMAGVITTSSLTTAGASSYAITWTNTFISATSVVLVTIAGGTNTTENITIKVAPGAGSATLTIYNNTAATALNGTILISYLVF
jgi:hypothetical protein